MIYIDLPLRSIKWRTLAELQLCYDKWGKYPLSYRSTRYLSVKIESTNERTLGIYYKMSYVLLIMAFENWSIEGFSEDPTNKSVFLPGSSELKKNGE